MVTMSRWRVFCGLVATVGFAAVAPVEAGARRGLNPTVDASIVHGTPAIAADWPFLVQLVDADTDAAHMSCSGAVISPTWVLTAAHCAAEFSPFSDDSGVVAADPEGFRVFAGGDSSFTGDARSVRRVVLHPSWQPDEFVPDADGDDEPDDLDDLTDAQWLDFLARLSTYDIALLELSSPVSTAPVRLATPADATSVEPGDLATVLGWGTITADDLPGIDSVLPPTPRRATLKLLDPVTLGVTAPGPLAVFARGTGQAVCHGDSGGPLVVAAPDGQLRIAGVTSTGLSCAPSEPSGAQFGNVMHLSSWIAQHVVNLPGSGARTPASFGVEGERAVAGTTTTLGRFSPVTPFRLLDSRTLAQATVGEDPEDDADDDDDADDEDFPSVTRGEVQAGGVGPIPATATGLMVNLTTIRGADFDDAVAGPCDLRGAYWSGFSSDTGAVAWATVMPLGPSGKVCFGSLGDAGIVVDVVGWFGPDGTDVFRGGAQRVADTRVTGTLVAPGSPLEVAVTATGTAVLNVTAIAGRRAGYVTAHPCATGPGAVSSVNVDRREIRSNLALVKVSPTSTVCVSTSTAMHVVVDQVGSLTAGSGAFVSFEEQIYEDDGWFFEDLEDLLEGDLDELDEPDTGYRTVEVAIDDLGLVSPSARSVVVNVVLSSWSDGYATAYSCDDKAPTHSTVNLNAAEAGGSDFELRAGAEGTTLVELGPSRSLCVLAPEAADLSLYLQGWFE